MFEASTVVAMAIPRTAATTPAHLVAEADQLQAAAAEFARVDAALVAEALAGVEGGEEFWAR